MEINAQKRSHLGKKIKEIRDGSNIPAVMYGKGIESEPLMINSVQFTKTLREAGETSLVDLNITDGKKEKVLIKDVQLDPITLRANHVSFYKVNLKEKTNANIPVEIIGEETNPLIKSGEGIVLVLINEIEVEALPSDLPRKFEINIADIVTIGGGVTFGQLNYDRTKVEIIGHDDEDLVVKIDQAGMAEEEVVAEPVSEADAIAKVAATKELSEEEKAKRDAEKSAEKGKEKK